jgi:hypothetical protein
VNFCVLFLIAVPLPPGKKLFAVQSNNNNVINSACFISETIRVISTGLSTDIPICTEHTSQ